MLTRYCFSCLRDLLSLLTPRSYSYRIRPLTDKEKGQAVGNDVAKIRSFEQALLGHYQQFLKLLHRQLKTFTEAITKHGLDNVHKPTRVLGLTSLKCLCLLLKECYHFNFRNNIVEVLVPIMSGKFGADVSLACLLAIPKLVLRLVSLGDIPLGFPSIGLLT